MSADGFRACPLALERLTHDLCEEAITTSRIVQKDPWTDVRYDACQACARAFDNWEPSDDDAMHGPNREGGIGFREEDTLTFRGRLKDAGRG